MTNNRMEGANFWKSSRQVAIVALFFAILISASCRRPQVDALLHPNANVADGIILKDSFILVYDTVVVTDSTRTVDTSYRTNAVQKIDNVRTIDTIRAIDTIRVIDTLKALKTVLITDTVRLIDSIKIYDTVRVTLPTPAGAGLIVGNGSGDLVINGQLLQGKSTSTIRIKSGNYGSIFIRDLHGTDGNPITVTNEGQVTIRVVMETNNINNVIISGAGSSSIEYGISFEDLSFRAIKMAGQMNGVTLTNMRFKNVRDYCISGENNNGRELRHDGTANTRTERFKILHCLFDNAGKIIFGGVLDGSGDTGFYKDVEIAYNIFKNTEAGSLCEFSNVEDYDVHHNVIDNVNKQNDDHNGIFFMQGNGHFHDNKLTNYQGNAIRAWIYSRGTIPSTIAIYNNICYKTRKYSGFEIQEFERNLIAGKTTYANAKVYNNTVGRMNLSKDWQGQLLDLYQLSGTVEYFNNLGFELFSSNAGQQITDMINNMGSTKITKKSNNLYFSAQNDAVYGNQASKHNGVGAALDF